MTEDLNPVLLAPSPAPCLLSTVLQYLSPCSFAPCLFIDFLFSNNIFTHPSLKFPGWNITFCLPHRTIPSSSLELTCRTNSVRIYVKRRTAFMPRVHLGILDKSPSSPLLLSTRNSSAANSSKYLGYLFFIYIYLFVQRQPIVATKVPLADLSLVFLIGLLFKRRC